MIYGQYPYLGLTDPELLQNIKTKQLVLEKQYVVVSDETKDLITKLLEKDKHKRIGWANIYRHPVFIYFNDLDNFQAGFMTQIEIQNQ